MSAPRDHRSRLREELVAAAARRGTAPTAATRSRRIGSMLVTAACIAVVAGVAATVALSRPAAADVFSVIVRDGEAMVTVDGLVEDPDDAAGELRNAGLDVSMIARPVPPSLEGAVVATTSEFGRLEADTDGTRVTAFRIPLDREGPVTIEYGRPARTGEEYHATEPVPECAAWAGTAVNDEVAADIAERWGPDIVLQEFNGSARTNLGLEDLYPGAAIVTILPLSANSVFVGVTDGSPPPPGLEC